jgi:hypothetical protein
MSNNKSRGERSSVLPTGNLLGFGPTRKIHLTYGFRQQGLEKSVRPAIDGSPVPTGESRLKLWVFVEQGATGISRLIFGLPLRDFFRKKGPPPFVTPNQYLVQKSHGYQSVTDAAQSKSS